MRSRVPPGARLTRRAFLRSGSAGGALLLVPSLVRADAPPAREIAFLNLHTGESLRAAFRSGRRYDADALTAIDHLLRDHRTDEVHPIAPGLLDLLADLAADTGSRGPFQVISGYRSPETNEKLRARGAGVVRRSFHTRGMAVDVRLPDVPSRRLWDAAQALARGGAGYYAGSDFVHLDVGPVRSW